MPPLTDPDPDPELEPDPDPDEVIQARLFSREALLELAQRGLLRDAKTLAGLVLAGAIDPMTPGG